MCINFTDLNKACPMDPFPLPRIDQLVDSTFGFTYLSLMDAFSGYNQIMMHPDDEEKIVFVTDQGLFCYKVMPFGLRNAGATYQRMVNTVFTAQIRRNVEAYVDHILVKSMMEKGHIDDLDETFDTMRHEDMKLNPKKSFFGLAGGKFLGFMVSKRGIEIHPSKSKAILNMDPPKNLKKLQSLTGRLAALNRFITKSGEVCLPFFKTMKRSSKFEWTNDCQAAFDRIK
jgi:Reverse transcriptase (RNA-dependent DNA polymerase)